MPRTRSRLFRPRNSPFWYAVWTDHQGAVRRQSTGCRDHGAAAAWLATRELERVKEGAGIPVARAVPLAQALAEYLVERKPTWSAGWYITVEGLFRQRVLVAFEPHRSVCTVTRADVERFRAAEVGRPVRGGRPASNATVNRLMAALAAFGEWCQVEGRRYATSNPWAKHPPLPEDQVPVPDVTAEQMAKVLAALDDPQRFRTAWRPLVEFALETGLRKSELARLRWEDVRLAERVAFVVSSGRRGRTKSRKLRAQALSLRAVEVLEALPRRIDGFVFGPVPDPRRALRTAAKAAGLDRVWLHLFRHLAASRVAGAGAGVHDLKSFGGWSSARMVERYTHSSHRRMLDLLDGRAAPGADSGLSAPPTKATGASE